MRRRQSRVILDNGCMHRVILKYDCFSIFVVCGVLVVIIRR
jgi:hypothetical protein